MASTGTYVAAAALVLLPLAAVAASSSSSGGGGGSAGGKPAPAGTRQKRLRCGFAATGLGDDWLRFLEQTAYRETGGTFNPNAWNKSSYERERSRAAAAKVDVIEGIDFDVGSWGFGSKGLFQFLGPYVAVQGSKLRFPKSFTNPNMAYNPGIAIAGALSFAGGLIRNWNNFEGSWASLNIGWGNPSKMGRASSIANSAVIMEDRAAKLGWPRGWARNKVPVIRFQDQNELAALANTAKLYYDAC